jgi:hypothetical protein
MRRVQRLIDAACPLPCLPACLQAQLPGPPLSFTSSAEGEVVSSLQVTLAMGTAELQGLTIGAAAAGTGAAAGAGAGAGGQPPGAAAAGVAAAGPGKPGGHNSRPPSASTQSAAPAAVQHPLQLAAGLYMLAFTSPGVAPALLLVNLLSPNSKTKP